MSSILSRFALLLITGGLLAGCGSTPDDDSDAILPDRKTEYKKARDAGRDLEIPPDLTRSSINDELVIPDTAAGSSATLSSFETRETVRGRVHTRAAVLPQVEDITVKRDGDKRWLEIRADAEEVWYKVVEFWQDNGILLIQQEPTVGVMVTDWLENRADIKTDIVTDTVRRLFDSLYKASTRDQFRVRIERGIEPGTTELYLTHRGMEEDTVNSPGGGDIENIIWRPREPDPGLEAEMLNRIMVYLGVSEQRARSALAAGAEPAAPLSTLKRTRDEVSLEINEGFDRAWRITGVALDRVGFAVEDRDRRSGLYVVRYSDPMAGQEEKGFFSKLAFWSEEEPDPEKQYEVRLSQGEEKTQVRIFDREGNRDNSETALRILTLLQEQIR